MTENRSLFPLPLSGKPTTLALCAEPIYDGSGSATVLYGITQHPLHTLGFACLKASNFIPNKMYKSVQWKAKKGLQQRE